MKKTGYVKKLIGSIAYLGLAMMLFPQTSFGQIEWAKDTGFVSREYRPRWFMGYENLGRYDLRKAPRYFTEAYETGLNAAGATTYNTRQVMSKVSYDPYGNFLLPGGSIYNVKWDTSRYGATSGNVASDPTAASPFYYAASVFNNLMISSDEFSDWRTKLIFGTTIRTFFTSSTLMMKNFNGMRWDASNRKNSVTLIAQPGTPGSISTLTMLGAHWQSILGDKLKVGGTFINRQRGTQAYSNTDIDSGIAGMRDTPRYIYLVLSDGSPTSTSNGPTIYDVRTFINGNDLTGQVPMRVFKMKDVLSSKRFYNGAFQRQYIFPVATGQDFYPRKDTDYAAADWFLTALNLANAKENMFSKTDITNFFGILNLPNPANPTDPQGRLYAADMSLGYQQATGTDVVIYEFMIPQEARDVKFKVLVANYYNIDLISAYYKFTQVGEASWNDQPFSPTYKDKWSVGYDVRNVARSTMNVRDLSNMQWVTIAYDRWTGWNVYGIDAQFVWGGLKINGEINEYNALFSYPVNENLTGGGRHKETTRAWFANLEQDFGKWGFGGEAYNYPLNYMKYNPVIENPYPGNIGIDVDWDMLNDTYWGTAPYLTYNYDLSPTGTYVAFGDDFNNNGTIDQRESYTTPYAIGYNGNHFFLKLKPRDMFSITLGRYNYKSVSVSYDNLMTYLKWEKFGKYSNFMEYSWQNRIEKRLLRYFYNSYYESSHSWKNTSFFHTRLNTAKLNVFNDFLWTWSESMIPFGAQILNVYAAMVAPESSIFQLIISPDQDLIAVGHSMNRSNKSPVTWTLTSVHKADYNLRVADTRILPEIYIGGYRILKEKRIKELTFQSQVYFTHAFSRAYSLKRDEYYTQRRFNAFPVVRLDYRVAPNTLFRFGLQGFPGIFPEITRLVNAEKYDDYTVLNNTNRIRMVLAFENRTLYQGFNLLVMAGVRKDKQSWMESRGRLEPGQTEYFISIQSEGVR